MFQNAAAYEAMFSQTLAGSGAEADEDYILGYPARKTEFNANT